MTDTEYVALQKSTIVRSYMPPRWVPAARAAGGVLSALAPGLAAGIAERLFLTPPRARRPAAERELLATARAGALRTGGRQVETWTWGTGPGALLVHGWGGRGAQLGAFVGPLVSHGFSVIAFDAPGHARKDRKPVTIPELSRALGAVAEAVGRPAGLVAHSLGALTAARALAEGLGVGAAVYVAPIADLGGPAARFTETFGFPRAVRERMVRRLEVRLGLPWSAFDLRTLASRLAIPLLVIHDRGDAEVPWQQGLAVARAWPGAEILVTEGLGHRRILRDPDAVAAAVAFLARQAARGPAAARAGGEALPALTR